MAKSAMPGLLDRADFCGLLNAAVRSHGSAVKLARFWGIPEQAVRDTQNLKTLDKSVVNALGLIKVLRYPSLKGERHYASPRQIQEKLTNFVNQHRTQRRAAELIGISEKQLSKIQNTDRGFTSVLGYFGYAKPVVFFIRKEQAHG